ncbi:MAG: LytR C-terminal domain-containing protein [Acidimicrobiales bacterium]
MNSGRHAAGPRPSGLALGRGFLLLVVALVVGIIVLRSIPTPRPSGAAATTTTTTTERPGSQTGKPTGDTTTTTMAPLAPAKVQILVANGTSVPVGAGNLVNALKALGYDVLVPYDTTAAATATAIYYASSIYKPSALTLASLLSKPASVVSALPKSIPVTTTATPNVVIIEGPNLAKRFASPVSLKTTSTTTSASTTSGG